MVVRIAAMTLITLTRTMGRIPISMISFPGIVNARAASFKIIRISRDDRKPVLQRGGGEQQILHRKSGRGHQPPPALGDLHTYGKNACRKIRQNRAKPCLDGMGLPGIGAALVFDASADFPNGEGPAIGQRASPRRRTGRGPGRTWTPQFKP
jgi:hypothetical protein